MLTRHELMVSSASVYPVCGWYVAEYRRYPLLGIAKGVMNAALARHWLLLYVPIWIWVLTRIDVIWLIEAVWLSTCVANSHGAGAHRGKILETERVFLNAESLSFKIHPTKPMLLDLFSGAGGAARGYQNAGFYVVGVDIKPQPRYAGDEFIQGDALEFVAKYGQYFDAIHASPPCQFASHMFCPTKPEKRQEHKNLIPQTRVLLQQLDKPYVIENVKGARKHLINPLMLHGSMYGLPIFRDRFFEMSHPIYFVPTPRRDYTPVPINSSSKEGNKHAPAKVMGEAMGINWMTKAELREAIPPAFTEFIGKHLMRIIRLELA